MINKPRLLRADEIEVRVKEDYYANLMNFW